MSIFSSANYTEAPDHAIKLPVIAGDQEVGLWHSADCHIDASVHVDASAHCRTLHTTETCKSRHCPHTRAKKADGCLSWFMARHGAHMALRHTAAMIPILFVRGALGRSYKQTGLACVACGVVNDMGPVSCTAVDSLGLVLFLRTVCFWYYSCVVVRAAGRAHTNRS